MNPDILSTLFKYFVIPKLNESDINKLCDISNIRHIPTWKTLSIDIHFNNDITFRMAMYNRGEDRFPS